MDIHAKLTTSYNNTITVENEAKLVGDLAIERQIRILNRWNAAAIGGKSK